MASVTVSEALNEPAVEIERKFVVDAKKLPKTVTSAPEHAPNVHNIQQGYLARDFASGVIARVRIVQSFTPKGGSVISEVRGEMTVKGPGSISRPEVNIRIDIAQAEALMTLCSTRIDKRRHFIPAENGLVWEVDEFEGALKGLWLAEIELPSVSTSVPFPEWVAEEVTYEPAFTNERLAVLYSSNVIDYLRSL